MGAMGGGGKGEGAIRSLFYSHNAAFYSITVVDFTHRPEAPRRCNRASLGRAPSPSSRALQSAAFKLLTDRPHGPAPPRCRINLFAQPGIFTIG